MQISWLYPDLVKIIWWVVHKPQVQVCEANTSNSLKAKLALTLDKVCLYLNLIFNHFLQIIGQNTHSSGMIKRASNMNNQASKVRQPSANGGNIFYQKQ